MVKEEPMLPQTGPWARRWLLPFADAVMEECYQSDRGGKISAPQALFAGNCILIALLRLYRVYLGVEVDGADSPWQISAMVTT